MGKFFSFPPAAQLKTTAILSIISALAGSFAGSILTATKTRIGTVVTQAELDAAVATQAEAHRLVDARVTVNEAATKETIDQLAKLEHRHNESDLARRAAREMLVFEIGKGIRLRAMVDVGLDPRRRAVAERAAAAVGTHYDDLVMRGVEPRVAADRALEFARIAR